MIEIHETEMIFKSDKKEKNGLTIIFIIMIVLTMCVLGALRDYPKETIYETSTGDIYFLNFLLGSVSVLLYSILISSWIGVRRTFIMSKDGCKISFWHYQKIYKWEEFKTKAEVDYTYAMKSLAELPYKRGVLFSIHDEYSSKWRRLLGIFHPLSSIGIYFIPDEKKFPYDEKYAVDEKIFLGKMKEWGVELEKIVYGRHPKADNMIK